MTIFFQLLLACTFLLAPPAVAAEKPSARWMAHCAANLKSEGLKPAVVQKYCACMAGLGDEDDAGMVANRS